MFRRLIVATAFFACAAVVGVVPIAAADDVPPVDDPPGCAVDALLVNSCRPWFGATANLYSAAAPDSMSQLSYFEQRTGRQMDVVHTYHAPGNDTLTPTDVYVANRPSTYLMVNWMLTNNWASAGGSDDTVNAAIDQMAASIKALGDTKIFLSLFTEPENDVTVAPSCTNTTGKGTDGTPADYRAMWANVRARFDAAGVTNTVWVMDYMNSPPYDCLIDDLYPGDDLVDWVVFNGYQHGNTNVDFVKNVGRFYDLLTAHSAPGHDYASKPWGIVEWGINNSTQQNAYLYYRQATAALEQRVFPRLHFYLVFDSGNWQTKDFSHRVGYDVNGIADPAEQAAFNEFAQSPALLGSGVQDYSPPTVPTDLSASVSAAGAVSLMWTAASDESGVVSYDVIRDGVVIGRPTDPAFTDVAPPSAQDHTYAVRAMDRYGNVSDGGSSLSLTVPDLTPPTRPTGLVATLANGVVTLAWSRSQDNVGVDHYEVLRNGVVISAPTASPMMDAAVAKGSKYTYAVRAVDGAGNVSQTSASVTKSIADTIAPTAPSSLKVSRLSRSATITWGPANDNVGVVGYVVYKGTTVVAKPSAMTYTYTFSNLTSGVKYTYRVAARDAAGHVGPALSIVG